MVGRSRRIVSSALTLAIAAIAGILLGEVISRWSAEDVVGSLTRDRPPAIPVGEVASARPSLPPAPSTSDAPRARHVRLDLEVDRTMRIDGGAPLGDVAALAAALRRRLAPSDVVFVAPDAGVPWTDVVELVDRVRSLGMRVSLHDAPPE
jgi:biopolymer transport protein ExbD